jgi:hypothetical protein
VGALRTGDDVIDPEDWKPELEDEYTDYPGDDYGFELD